MAARVLLVEDELALANLLARFLVRAGFAPVICGTAAAALARWDDRCAVAVVDLGLPDMPGEQLVAKMRSQMPLLPIVVSSGTPTDNAAVSPVGSETGIHFLQKPYLPGQLVELLASLKLET
jgi:DNA-binding response OmpR family regulator